MPEMFDRMMGHMARNPATGFADALKDQEAVAIRGTTLSAAEERRIGRKQRDAFLRTARTKGYTVREVARDVDYLKALVAKFKPRMKNRSRYPEIEVTLLDAPIPDGQSFPGGFLVFTSALLDEPDEATVAAVVAHEMNHLDRGHLNEYAKREKLADTMFKPSPDAFANPAAMMNRGMALGSLMMDPFRPEHEHEADCAAATWLFQEGYNPHALADFFTRMNRRNRDQPDSPFWKIARSHPYSLARREAVLDRLAQLQRWKTRDNLGLFAQNLKDRKVKEQ
jgi:predicted Zn-dependent protease